MPWSFREWFGGAKVVEAPLPSSSVEQLEYIRAHARAIVDLLGVAQPVNVAPLVLKVKELVDCVEAWRLNASQGARAGEANELDRIAELIEERYATYIAIPGFSELLTQKNRLIEVVGALRL